MRSFFAFTGCFVVCLVVSGAAPPATKPQPAAQPQSSAESASQPMTAEQQQTQIIDDEDGYNKLSREERRVILSKGTERAFIGKLTDNKSKGTYLCRRCNAALYESESKFNSNCGWPSFDDEIKGTVRRLLDIDGVRTEIVCANCDGHLGHVFLGERFTQKNTRHCVNSISMIFVEQGEPIPDKLVLRSKAEAEQQAAATEGE